MGIKYLSKIFFVFKTFFSFLVYFWRIVYIEILLTLIIRIILAIIPGFQLFITKNLIDSINEVFQGQSHIELAIKYLIYQTLILIFVKVLHDIDRINGIKMQNKITLITEEKIVNKTSSISILHFENSQFYDKLLRASSGQSQRVVELFNGPLQMLQNLITIVTLIGTISTFHWIMSVTVLILAILPLLVNINIGKLNFRLNKEITPLSRLINYYLSLLKHRDTAKEVRIFQLQNYIIEKWKTNYKIFTQRYFSFQLLSTYLRSSVESIGQILIAVNLGIIVWQGVSSGLSIGDYMAISQAFVTIQGVLVSISYAISSLYSNSLEINEFIQFLEMSEELTIENTNEKDPSQRNLTLEKGITVNNLTFSYDEDGPLILDNISFNIPPNGRLAIVGDNGAGKSTLIKCLLGLYRTYKGNIFYGEIELKEIPPRTLFKIVSAVFQDFCKYELTVNENIAFGNIAYINDKRKIQEAVRKGGVDSFINQLPLKLDTQLGRSFEGGSELSGGQWQKIAISRAFLRDSEIIILDEPTASLDPFAEAVLFEKFSELSKGKISIMVSHRLNSCLSADLILVMKNGKIVERGTHNDLLILKGYYYEMFYMQVKNYQNSEVSC